MINIPNELWDKYGSVLTKKTVPSSFHNHYKKWLRYYLDCRSAIPSEIYKEVAGKESVF